MIDRSSSLKAQVSSATHPLLIQVVPRLIPGRCGVSDQAVFLARELKEAFAIDSAFVVLNSNERSDLPYLVAHCLPSQLLETCLKLTEGRPGAMLIHMSGYGYSADGAPTLLAESLETVRGSGQFRIAVFFHETFASGPPWKSAFWHSHRQQKALRRIIAQSGLNATSTGRHVEWLGRESRKQGGFPIELMPVFSAAGETDALLPFNERKPVMLVFGLAGTRRTAYQMLGMAGNLVGILGIQEILDVGPECDCPSNVSGIRVKRMGLVPAEQLPVIFAQAQFGFVTHEWFCLGKSSVFAGYCAQGTIPVLTGPFPEESDGLREGVHVVSPRTAGAARDSGWESCSRAAWTWYNGHRLHAHAELYAKWMENRGE
jgi:hypothetical protein